MKIFNDIYCDEENNEWLICPVCGKQLNFTPKDSKRLVASKNLHHIFGGAYKSASELFGYCVYLHPECHRQVHDDPKMEKALKVIARDDFLKDHTEKEFIKKFGKSYR